MNLFRETSLEKNIIKNEEVFYPDYMPEELLNRRNEIKEIVFCLKGMEEKKRPPSIFIHGPPGTGKTSAVKYVINELRDYTKRAKAVMVNCWNTQNRYGILSKITSDLDIFIPQTGVPIEEMFSRIKKTCEIEGFSPLIILDEADVLVKSKEENQALLYDILRLNESQGINAGVIIITNDVSFLLKVDRRIKSSLAQSVIEFKPYTPAQLKEILIDRAKSGLLSDTYDEEVIGICAGFGAKNNGDARIALNLLWLAAKDAEMRNQQKILIANVDNVKEKVKVITQQNMNDQKLTPEESEILKAIGDSEITSGDLYKKLSMNERTIRNYLMKMEQLGVIEVTLTNLKSGRTKIIKRKMGN